MGFLWLHHPGQGPVPPASRPRCSCCGTLLLLFQDGCPSASHHDDVPGSTKEEEKGQQSCAPHSLRLLPEVGGHRLWTCRLPASRSCHKVVTNPKLRSHTKALGWLGRLGHTCLVGSGLQNTIHKCHPYGVCPLFLQPVALHRPSAHRPTFAQYLPCGSWESPSCPGTAPQPSIPHSPAPRNVRTF